MTRFVLHNYWRSSASQRVRTGLHLKGLAFEYVTVNIVANDQFGDAYRVLNPHTQVPTLVITELDGTTRVLTQSLAILEYLDERFSGPEYVPLLPRDAYLRARSRSLAELVNSGIQPHQNLSTMRKVAELGGDPSTWPRSFIAEGLASYDRACADVAGTFSVGDAPTLADLCLIPQLFSARRFKVPFEAHPRLVAIEAACLALPAFAKAVPDQQPDAVPA